MKFRNKRLVATALAFIMCLGMLFSMPTNSYAGEIPSNGSNQIGTISNNSLLRWAYTTTTSQGMSIKNGTATMTADVGGIKGTTTQIVIYMYLQQQDGTWKNIFTSRDSYNDYSAAVEHTYSSCATGYSYQTRFVYYVYSGSSYETITAYSSTYIY